MARLRQPVVEAAPFAALDRDLERVAQHYACSPDELAEMRATAQRDPVAARTCFHHLARECGLS
jgi:hypothetical protein